MKVKLAAAAVALAILAATPRAHAGDGQPDLDRDRSTIGKMFNKLGRGIVNGVTCWVEIPRNVAIEWERTDPVTGIVLGGVKGVGFCFARFATGVYEAFTFPFPIPDGYLPMMEPEFVVTDVWGDPIPDLTELDANDPLADSPSRTYPQQFRF